MEDESRYDHNTQGEIINMAKKSKQMRAALEKIDSTKAYSCLLYTSMANAQARVKLNLE